MKKLLELQEKVKTLNKYFEKCTRTESARIILQEIIKLNSEIVKLENYISIVEENEIPV
jgi:division protein CdvB (Snf7/Vps24/ESCRT-III family)